MTTPMWVTSDDGTEVAAYDFGGEGEPVLFAHATGFHAHLWLPIIDLLRDRFHCYALDERGHGATPTPITGDFAWERGADDIRAVVAAFGLERPRGVGHSAGGALLVLAEEDQPGSWQSLWVFEPVIFPGPPPGLADNPLAAGARRRRAHFDSLDAAYENFAAKPPFNSFTPASLRAYVDHGFVEDPAGGVTLACRPDDEAATYEQAVLTGAWARLDEIKIPVHAVAGADTSHLPGQVIGDIVARLPHGSLEVMDGLSHFGPFEDPPRIAASILSAFA